MPNRGWTNTEAAAISAHVAAEVAKEQECLRVMLAALHREAKGQHNLYHCLAVELFGDAAIRKGE